MNKEEINNSFAAIHETEIKEEDFLLTYDTGMVFEPGGGQKINDIILEYVHTTGSALVSGKYAGHGFSLRNFTFREECEWVIKKHIGWNNNVRHIAIPVKRSAIVFTDDEEKIAYRMMLQKILRVDKPDLDTMREHIKNLLDQYSKK